MSAGGAKTGALVRSIEAMTSVAIRSHTKARDDRLEQGLGELDQQFHLPISGTATAETVLTEIEVEFDAPFIDAYDERQSPYEDPTFTSGVFMPKGGKVQFGVCVRRWKVIDGVYTGADIGITAYTPGEPIDFSGEIHLNFQGYAAPTADETDEGDSP